MSQDNTENNDAALAEYREFKKLRQGYKDRIQSGYYSQLNDYGQPRTDLHDDYDNFVAYQNEKRAQGRPKLESAEDIEYSAFRRQKYDLNAETFLASAPN